MLTLSGCQDRTGKWFTCRSECRCVGLCYRAVCVSDSGDGECGAGLDVAAAVAAVAPGSGARGAARGRAL